jgi:methionyl-tRNA formyltransferase
MRLTLFFDHSVGNILFSRMINDDNIDIMQCVTSESNFEKNPWIQEISDKHNVQTLIFEKITGIQQFKDTKKVLLASWKYILSDELLDHFNHNVFNLHYSLLPKYPGSYPVNQAILSGEVKTGFTIHIATSQLDGGPVVLQKSLDIDISENTEDVLCNLDKLVSENYDLIVRSMDAGFFKELAFSRSHRLVSKQEIDKLRSIDITAPMTALEFLNKVRSMTLPQSNVFPIFVDPVSGSEIEIQLKLIRRELI